MPRELPTIRMPFGSLRVCVPQALTVEQFEELCQLLESQAEGSELCDRVADLVDRWGMQAMFMMA